MKRRRRSREEIQVIRDALYEVLAEDHPQTVRQVFYRLTTMGVIAKTEAEYKRTVCRLLAEMRRSRQIPFNWLADATRWQRGPTTFSGVDEAFRRIASTYRRSLWEDSSERVELWLEKEALSGILIDVSYEWDVPLMVCRGYPSMSYLHSAAEQIVERAEHSDQTTVIYYMGDRDPSGLDIDRAVVEGIDESIRALVGLDPQVLWSFKRIGVTEAQVVDLGLPSRPTKKTDSRAKSFAGESVELDAIPADQLRMIASLAIESHVDHHRLDVLRKVEAEERAGLEAMAGLS